MWTVIKLKAKTENKGKTKTKGKRLQRKVITKGKGSKREKIQRENEKRNGSELQR